MANTAPSASAVRRWGPGTAAIVRLLVAAGEPLTGVAIAAAVGVTQPRVSQVLKELVGQEVVTSAASGYLGDPDRLLDLYRVRGRPNLIEPERYWYSLRPSAEQARRLLDAAEAAGIAAAFSADLAPDLLAPWRHPSVTVAYSDAVLALDEAGFVLAEGRAAASLIVRATADASLLRPSRPWIDQVDGLPLTDPCLQWRDLLDLGGEDRVEAADRLRRTIIDRTLPRS